MVTDSGAHAASTEKPDRRGAKSALSKSDFAGWALHAATARARE